MPLRDVLEDVSLACVGLPADPATLIAVVLTMLAVAGIASLAPALRAARIEPVQVLRDE